jgi:MFS family permease
MTTPPDPTNPKRSGGIHVGDLTGDRDVHVTLTDVAGGDQIKITNSPGATVIREAPRKLTREEQLAQRNRQTMLAKVKKIWVDGVLADLLHSKVIPLDMQRNPGAVTRPRPWDMLWQIKDQPPEPLPPGTHIIDRFQYTAGEALLILGEPGSGKTTMLLDVARDLLAQATSDESLRIPVIFKLSSWATQQLPLTDWLIAELQSSVYQIDKKTAQAWVEQDDIFPLLDGLDEIIETQRTTCIRAINTYRGSHGLTPLIVCSRTADYTAIGEKLLLSDALILRPLTPDQINDYLLTGGPALDGVRLALQQDNILRKMAQSPLLLSIMAQTYHDQTPEQFTSTNLDERRRQLLTTYIQHQLPQRQKDEDEDPATTLRQLTYLAHQMIAHNQTIFLIERLQPTWLPTPQLQSRYNQTVELVLGLVFWLAFWLIGGLAVGLIVGLIFWLAFGLVDGWNEIKPMEKVRWSWKYISRRHVILGLVVGVGGGLLGGLGSGLSYWLNGGLLGGLLAGLFAGLFSGLVNGQIEMKTIPNEGIKNSTLNATRIGLVVGLVSELIFGLFGGLVGQLGFGLSFGLRGALIFGLLSGIGVGGGLAVIQHYALRFWLQRYGYLPLKLVPFLDLAAERLILQKVGGGYQFMHRLLQEYLAGLNEQGSGRG